MLPPFRRLGWFGLAGGNRMIRPLFFQCELQVPCPLHYLSDFFENSRKSRHSLRKEIRALTGVAQLVQHCPAKGPQSDPVCARGNWSMFLLHIDVSLPLFLPPFPSL